MAAGFWRKQKRTAGIKQFFQKVGKGIAGAAKKVWGGIKTGAKWVGQHIIKPVVGGAAQFVGTALGGDQQPLVAEQ